MQLQKITNYCPKNINESLNYSGFNADSNETSVAFLSQVIPCFFWIRTHPLRLSRDVTQAETLKVAVTAAEKIDF